MNRSDAVVRCSHRSGIQRPDRRWITGRIAKAPTANAHIKRLLHESFHRDPRAVEEDVMAAQLECLASPETAEANRAWTETREAVFRPRPHRA